MLLLLACGSTSAPDPEPPVTAHWMADTYADRQDTPLARILLPGAFNSTSYTVDVDKGISPDAPAVVVAMWGDDATANPDNRRLVVDWARTQDRSLAQQLDAGVRFLELNVTMREGVVTTWHSVYGVPLQEVLGEVVAFADRWPGEAVVLSFGLTMDAAGWPAFVDVLEAPYDGVSLCDLLYNGDAGAATLADLGERNVVWAADGDLAAYLEERACPASSGAVDRVWSITDSTDGVEAALQSSVDSRDPGRLLINDFAFSLDGAETEIEQFRYLTTYAGVREVSEALGFSGGFAGTMIERYNASGDMNVFAGAYTQDTDLVAAAIAANGG